MSKVQSFVVAIPARYAATRLPGKPLLSIGGEPMVLRVARRALAAGAEQVVVATDDERVAEALRGAAVRVVMTRADHASGSDRLAECAEQLGWPDDTIVVNLQGDEPLAPPSGIRAVAAALAEGDAPMATLATGITSAGDSLLANADLRAELDAFLTDQIANAAEKHRDQIADLVARTVAAWDPEVAARRLELAVGSDLQFIRINGTLVGGLVGLILHLLKTLV